MKYYPELEKWFNKHIADTHYLEYHFNCGFEAQDVEMKLLSMQQQVDSLTEQNKELQEREKEVSGLAIEDFYKYLRVRTSIPMRHDELRNEYIQQLQEQD